MADKKIAQSVEDLVTVYKTLFLDLPLAGAKWGLGIGGEKETMEAAWKGYDANVRLANAAIDNFYQTPLFGEVMARSLNGASYWQWLSNALAGTFFTGLWQPVGLPTTAETQALRAEVQALSKERRAHATGLAIRSTARKAVTKLEDARMKSVQVKKMQENVGVNPLRAAA